MLEQISSKMRNPTWVIAVIALVFAMAGGAWAASKALTSKQKKEVEKIAKKYAGKDGLSGQAGAPGIQGVPGAPGTNGKDGKDGEPGASVVEVGDPACEQGGVVYEIEGSNTENEICNGANGQDAGFNFTFNASTGATDPGAGKLALNNATTGQATKLLISKTEAGGTPEGLKEVIANWLTSPTAKGMLLIRKAGEPATFAEYAISGLNIFGLNDEGEGETFYEIIITSVAGQGSFANGDPVTIAYWGGASPSLPKGATETGTWAFSGTEAENGDNSKRGEGILAPVSFQVPLNAFEEIPREHIFYPTDSGWAAHCQPFTANFPGVKSAEYAGSLETTACFFQNEENTLNRATFAGVWGASFGAEENLTRTGGFLQFHATGPGVAYASGAWAVQAH